ncbi:dihydrolipoamide acetyltransferase family protein [Nonomuraea sediminis]|uniref:dihydrolipoamide acetyltransferase family protein n=1 Tax=Nonomuraea sediminis TaxID=2835864 RepID=UPI001BDCC4BD|nr:dihydrolipoamide acetyltransferase family protein [Nonomuraea sediminis]
MTTSQFTLPDLGEGLTEAEIVRWLVKVGDQVTVDQPIVEVETAKATVELPTPYAGVVTAQPAAEGDVVAVGAPIITITDAAAARYIEEERAGSGNVLVGYGTSATGRARRVPRRPATAGTGKPLVISPVVRRLARENAVDLTTLTGSAPGGVITRADVTNAITASQATLPEEPAPQASAPLPLPVLERIPLRGARRAAAELFTRSRREIPEATTWVDVDATELVQLRRTLNAKRPIGLLALIARFVIAGLARHPVLNSRVDTEAGEILVLDGVNLGFAAQTDHGLVVPVIKDAHRLSAAALHDELTRLTAAARDGALTPADLTGGTFTLNNYGVFGVDGAAPIINHPETAILGLGRIIDRPWAVDGTLAVRKIAQLSFAFDHRVCDGGTAASFLRFMADSIEDPQQALTTL